MVTTTAGLAIPLNASDLGTTDIGFRRALATLFRQSVPGVAVPGRLGADHFAVSGSPSSMQYIVTGGGIVLVRSAANGAYLVGMPTSVTVSTSIADVANPRIDRIYVLQPDPALDGSGVAVNFIIDVAVGTPGSSPALPALPTGAFELARKVVAAGAGNTAGGAAFTNVAAVTSLSRGIVPLTEGGTGGTSRTTARAGLGITSGTTDPTSLMGENGDIYLKIVG